jgi:hypothetical protein
VTNPTVSMAGRFALGMARHEVGKVPEIWAAARVPNGTRG